MFSRPSAIRRPKERFAGERFGIGGNSGKLTAERREQEHSADFARDSPCRTVQFPWEVQRIDGIGVGIDVDGGVGDIVADERDILGNRARVDIGCCNRRVLGEARGDIGSLPDGDLDKSIEASEACGECAGS